mmetsp:Transcript_19118/g.64588  ORF Transcript_19118/g.64588 Transcript_19118/m.64588 type:complete len:211 (-) Transcript_19118:645-1277(-)
MSSVEWSRKWQRPRAAAARQRCAPPWSGFSRSKAAHKAGMTVACASCCSFGAASTASWATASKAARRVAATGYSVPKRKTASRASARRFLAESFVVALASRTSKGIKSCGAATTPFFPFGAGSSRCSSKFSKSCVKACSAARPWRHCAVDAAACCRSTRQFAKALGSTYLGFKASPRRDKASAPMSRLSMPDGHSSSFSINSGSSTVARA